MGESTVIVQQRSTAVGRSGAKQAREAKGREADLGAVHLKKQKWTFSSRLKNLFSSERRTAKLKERQAIAASVKQSASSAAMPDLTDIIVSSDSKDKSPSQDGRSSAYSMAESTQTHASNIGVELHGDGAQYAEDAARIFENPLYNPHLDSAGDDQVYNDIVKNRRGDSLLGAFCRPVSSSTVLLKTEQIRFHYGLDKAEPRTRMAIVGSIGDLVARNFTTASSDSLANQVFAEIHKHGFGSSRSRIDDISSFDWKFKRNKENGAVTARYEINFLNSSGDLARASGSIEVSSDGELLSASRITVSGMGERNMASPSAKRVIERDDSAELNAAASEGLYDLPPTLSDEGDDALSEEPLDLRWIEADQQLPELPPDDIDEVDHGPKLSFGSACAPAWASARPSSHSKIDASESIVETSQPGLSRSNSADSMSSRGNQPGTHSASVDQAALRAAAELKADLAGKYANPFAGDAADLAKSGLDDLDRRRQQQGNSSMRTPQRWAAPDDAHLRAAAENGITQVATNARAKKNHALLREGVREGAKKLKTNLTTTAKIVGENARLYTSEETKKLRNRLPPELANLSDPDVRQLAEDMKKGGQRSAGAVLELWRGNAPTKLSLEQPITWLTGYVLGMDYRVKHWEGRLCSELLRRMEKLPGGAPIVDQIPVSERPSLTLEKVNDMASTLPTNTSEAVTLREQMLAFIEGAAKGSGRD